MTCVTELNRHQKAVNVVRFSPSGEILASGDDGMSTIFNINVLMIILPCYYFLQRQVLIIH